MAEPKTAEFMDKIVSLCKRKGFIFQSSEIYGGINGFWDYGPLGVELRKNIRDCWWNDMVRRRDDVVGLESSIIMHPKVWEASGRSEEHTSELQSHSDLVCRLLLEKKKDSRRPIRFTRNDACGAPF